MSDTSGAGYMIWPNNGSESEFDAFHNERDLAKVRGLIPVTVKKVYKIDGKSPKTQGAVEPAGFVDVQPLVSQVDGQNQKMDHGTIYHVPYTRVYGGNAAIIMDPTVGDVGFVKVADRDISSFKDGYAGGNAGPFTPNSRRRHDLADSVYLGGILSKTPKQWLTFGQDGSVNITDANNNSVTWNSKGITVNAPSLPVVISGTPTVTLAAPVIVVDGVIRVGK